MTQNVNINVSHLLSDNGETCGQFFSRPQTFMELQLCFKLHFYTKKMAKKHNWSSRNICGQLKNWPLEEQLMIKLDVKCVHKIVHNAWMHDIPF